MPRPATKSDLIKTATEQFEKLQKLISSMTCEEQSATFNFDEELFKKEAHWKRDKNLRDVLIHLYEWHQLLLDWINSNTNGNDKSFLPESYSWKTYGDMNVKFWESHQSTPYEASNKMLIDSHKKVMSVIEQFSNEELFENKHFKWTGTTSLGSYCISATSSHYDWAHKKIKKHIQTTKTKA